MWGTFEKSKASILDDGLNGGFREDTALRDEIFGVMFSGDSDRTYSERKATAVCRMLESAEINAGEENIFVYKINHSRIMHKVIDRAGRELKRSCINEEKTAFEQAKAFKAMMDFGHVAPD